MDRASLSDRLSREIVATIREDGLRPGQPIPSARRLAERFEVTVPTVREALRRLEATSMIELRHGSGTYVGEAVDRPFLLNPFIAEGTLDSALDLARARLVLEPQVAAEAARHRTASTLTALTATLDNALEEDPGAAAPSTFHAALASATGNSVLADLVSALLELRTQERATIRAIYSDRLRDHSEHAAILSAVSDGDADRAAHLTHEHLTSICDHLLAAKDRV